MNLAAFIVTFNRPATLDRTIQTVLAQTRPPETILVLDNSSLDTVKLVAEKYAGHGVVYHDMGHNAGPAGAAAYGLDRLSRDGHDWIFWGDDDDPPKTPDSLERLANLAAQSGADVAGVGAVGGKWNWQTGRVERLPDEALHGTIEVDMIAGGNQFLLRGSAVLATGLPDARLFFGFEEYEYCLRLREKHRLLVDGDLMYEYRALAGRLALAERHALSMDSPRSALWRRYYGTRNYIFVMLKTFDRPDLARQEVKRALGRSLLGWARGLRYGYELAETQLRAVRDAYQGRMGRTLLPRPQPDAPDAQPSSQRDSS